MVERWVVATLVVLGYGFTATNGVIAYRSAKDRLTRVGRRLKKSRDEQGGSSKPSMATLLDDSADDAVQRVLHALQASRTSLLLAGVGLLVSAIADVWALFLPA